MRQHVRRFVPAAHTAAARYRAYLPAKYDGITELWFDHATGIGSVFGDVPNTSTRIRPERGAFLDLHSCGLPGLAVENVASWLGFAGIGRLTSRCSGPRTAATLCVIIEGRSGGAGPLSFVVRRPRQSFDASPHLFGAGLNAIDLGPQGQRSANNRPAVGNFRCALIADLIPERSMKQNVVLTVASLLSLLFMTLHVTHDVIRQADGSGHLPPVPVFIFALCLSRNPDPFRVGFGGTSSSLLGGLAGAGMII